jgi:hypothetical protein
MPNVLSVPHEIERLADRALPGRQAAVTNEALRQGTATKERADRHAAVAHDIKALRSTSEFADVEYYSGLHT